jgi:hypothetical protein
MRRRVDGCAAEQCCITPLVKAGCPRAPPTGVFACWRPTRRSGGVRASGWRHVAWTASWSKMEIAHANEQVVGGEDSSCEAETPPVKRRLVVWDGDLSEEPSLVRRLSRKLLTGRKHDILPVRVLTEIFSPPYPESWPSRSRWCQKTPPQEWLSRH